MGWLMTAGQTKKELIAKLNEDEENSKAKWETLASCVRGSILWQVIKYTDKDSGKTESFIVCNLMTKDGDYGWGYKNIEEQCGPAEVSCPLAYLEMIPCPGGYAPGWRERVRAHHKEKAGIKVKVGDKVRLRPNNSDIDIVRITSLRPLMGMSHLGVHRIKKSLLFEIVHDCL